MANCPQCKSLVKLSIFPCAEAKINVLPLLIPGISGKEQGTDSTIPMLPFDIEFRKDWFLQVILEWGEGMAVARDLRGKR